LTSWEGSTTRRNGVATSVGGEATSERGNKGDDTSWVGVNLIGPKKINKTHAIDSITTNDY
jgi:hypothetical protein